ncbi:MAG: sulfatase-like hydrolase/transferase [Planctomycetes bacterium]|nr:sulfatase-like hydrolase/transferase [Planctomycetota bacterium]
MRRRGFLGGLAAGAAALAGIRAAPDGADAPAPTRTSFVVFLCDDLGYGDLGCFGHPTIETPHLDRLAGEGTKLTACYAAAPVCSPSRAGMMTGRTPNRTGVYDWIPAGAHMHLPAEEVTIARLLRDAGYATCHAGKWHLNGRFNSPEQPQPGDHGFRHWFATQNNADPSHRNPVNFVRNGEALGPLDGYSSDLIAGEAVRWLKGLDDGQPFFLFVSFHAPHEPVASPEAFVRKYAGEDPPERVTYYASVTELDAAVGRVLAALGERGLAERTLVFFTSDNGPETLKRYAGASRSYGSPGPYRGMKLSLYDGGIRVPGILRWPGRTKPGTTCDEAICGTDILPTFCAIAGIPLPDDRKIDGASVLPILEGKPVARAVPLYWQYDKAIGGPQLAIRDGDWKLLADPVAKTVSLFNLREDPAERDERAAQETDRRKALARKLGALRAEVAMEGPTWPSPIPPGGAPLPVPFPGIEKRGG